MQTKRWLTATGSALCLLSAACGGDEAPGTNNNSAGSAAGTGSTTLPQASGAAGLSAAAGRGGASAAVPPATTAQANQGRAGAPSGIPAMAQAGEAAPPHAGSPAVATAGSPAVTPIDPSTCPPAPDGAAESAVTALNYLNSLRLPAGAGCVRMVLEINKAAENHCKYYVDPANEGMCNANAHNEVMGCAGFTGTGPGQRMAAAGYMARGGGEVMAFSNNPKSAIDQWVNSVWHRIPLLDPWTGDMGYGAAPDACDTIDFGNSAMGVPNTTVLVYPYDGQTDVPTSFNGEYEGPMPPAPTSGWPSASPVTLYARMLNVTEHVLTKDGDTTPIEHVWITGSDPMWGNYLRTSVFMYANTPYEPMTKYRVVMKGTSQAGPLDRTWTFTTGAAPTRGGRPRP
jgi:uncharacterized protein YkwD